MVKGEGEVKDKGKEENVLRGTISEGKLEGETFIIYFNESPAKMQVFVGDRMLLLKKLVIEMDVEEPVTKVSFEGYQIINK